MHWISQVKTNWYRACEAWQGKQQNKRKRWRTKRLSERRSVCEIEQLSSHNSHIPNNRRAQHSNYRLTSCTQTFIFFFILFTLKCAQCNRLPQLIQTAHRGYERCTLIEWMSGINGCENEEFCGFQVDVLPREKKPNLPLEILLVFFSYGLKISCDRSHTHVKRIFDSIAFNGIV